MVLHMLISYAKNMGKVPGTEKASSWGSGANPEVGQIRQPCQPHADRR